jgi:lysyl-tRNA synthetase class 2
MDRLRLRARSLRHAMTDAEQALWRHLRGGQMGVRFRRQHPVAGFVLDFASPSIGLAIELDGGQHVQHQSQDARRSDVLSRNGYLVLRFWNDAVLVDSHAVREEIWRVVHERAASVSGIAGAAG